MVITIKRRSLLSISPQHRNVHAPNWGRYRSDPIGEGVMVFEKNLMKYLLPLYPPPEGEFVKIKKRCLIIY
jgi:hypothetical protein